jgi:4-carboxymuconolactone decarboxylase
MTRFEPLSREQMNQEQGNIYDDIAARGGRLGGPYTALIRIPRFMKLQQEMGDYPRDNSLSGRERQLAVLRTVRHWNAAYAWAVQERASLGIGLEPDVIDAINAGETPELANRAERAIHQVAGELLAGRGLGDDAYDRAVQALGLERLTDVIATVGFFSLVSCTLNGFDIDPPEDAPARLM